MNKQDEERKDHDGFVQYLQSRYNEQRQQEAEQESQGRDEGIYQRMDGSNISVADMQQMQTNLRIAKGWTDMDPSDSKDHMLYMIEKMGEVIQIVKKKGINKIMSDPEIRALTVEELTDVIMYYMEVLNRLRVTPKEFSQAYIKKHMKNLGRDYNGEWHKKLVDEDKEEEGKGIDD